MHLCIINEKYLTGAVGKNISKHDQYCSRSVKNDKRRDRDRALWSNSCGDDSLDPDTNSINNFCVFLESVLTLKNCFSFLPSSASILISILLVCIKNHEWSQISADVNWRKSLNKTSVNLTESVICVCVSYCRMQRVWMTTVHTVSKKTNSQIHG